MSAKIEIVKAKVAPRRTVKFEGKYRGPGCEVSLPKDEVQQLRKLGYLVDPDAPAPPPTGVGPEYSKEANVATITQV